MILGQMNAYVNGQNGKKNEYRLLFFYFLLYDDNIFLPWVNSEDWVILLPYRNSNWVSPRKSEISLLYFNKD